MTDPRNMNDADPNPDLHSVSGVPERLLRLSADLDAFERDLGVAPPIAQSATTDAGEHALPLRWSYSLRGALAAAACLALVATAWIMWDLASPTREAAPVEVVAIPPVAPSTPDAAAPSPAPAPAVLVADRAPVIGDSPIVHRFVALYRDDLDPDGRCSECWCVAQLAVNVDDGRMVSDMHEDELVQTTLSHACVIDPKRIVIVGLTGPANAMPTTDAEALAMSLCLLKTQTAIASANSEPAAAHCLPPSVDYCMTTWDK